MTKEAIAHYEAALKEAFPSGATGDVFHHWNEARKILSNEALDRMAENARELGLDYNTTSDERLMKMPEPAEWKGLTDEEIDQGLLRSDYALQTAHAWRAGVVFAMTQLKEKNT